MIPIHQLLARFKNLTNTEKAKKEFICAVLRENNIPITINQISFSKKSIIIKANPIIKTELSLQKESILAKVRSIEGLSNISDIQ